MNMSALKNPLMAILWGAVLVGAATSAYVIVAVDDGTGALSTFTSRSQLESYIDEMYGGSYWSERAPSSPDGAADAEYSSTNVQVQGVDEGDEVKTDGEYIYLATSENVTIADAVPADQMRVVGAIQADSIVTAEEGVETHVRICGLLLHGDRLVVIAVVHSWAEYDDEDVTFGWIIENFSRTVAAVYDISDASDPAMVGLVGLSGGYLTSRAVDGVAYLVTNHFIHTHDETDVLPVVSTEAGGEEVDVTDILYDPTASDVGSFTNILALDTETMDFEALSVLTGHSSTIYMSAENLYLTYQKWTGDVIAEDGDLEPEESNSATTAIHKVGTDGLSMRVTASGTVTGWLLNQFSMDERDGYLRVATTTSWENQENAVYVLDHDLEEIGALEGLAPDERIYSARFIDDRLYLVTFLQMDPLFVIDLSDPADPKVLGELEMPGFSTYLHPAGDGLLIGVGMENWTLKVALYDVSDPDEPKELGRYLSEASYTYSAAEYDHKAFLFDPTSGRLVLPVSSHQYYTDGSYAYWQGFYVMEVGADTGVQLVGEIEHGTSCSRALTIGGTLYTISNLYVLANDLGTLDLLGSLTYGMDWDHYYYDVPVMAD